MYSKGLFIAFSCAVASIIAAPADVPPEKLQPTVIPIVSQSEEVQANGSYKFSYETGNGILREETAFNKLIPKGRDASSNEGGESNESEEIHVQRGSYSYTAPDGTIISVRYIADENGFQPIYEHIPNKGSVSSAEKSGRALKLETSETSIGLAPRIGSSQSSEVSTAEKTNAQTEVASEASSEPVTVPEAVSPSVPEAVPAVVPEAASDSSTNVQPDADSEGTPAVISQEAPKVDPENSSVTNVEPATAAESVPSVIPESAPEVVPESTPAVEAVTTSNVALPVSTESSQTVTDSGATEASELTTPNVDVSTEVASTAAPAQPPTEPEQGTTASAELPSTTAPEQPSSSEVVESSPSTSAPEQSSTAEAIGPQAVEESVASSPAEEVGQPATSASEPATTQESGATTISA